MATPFAALETRLNQAVGSRLANAQAAIAGAAPVAGIFERRAGDALSYVSGNRPVFQCTESLAADVQDGDVIHITTDTGAVLFDGEVARVEPDGAGWLLLQLQEQA